MHRDLTNLWILLSLGSAFTQAGLTALVLMALLTSSSSCSSTRLASLLVPVAGIAVTTWMIGSSSGGGGPDKSRPYPASFDDEIANSRRGGFRRRRFGHRERMTDGYSAEPKPLKSYAVLVGAFNVAVGTALVVRGRFPDRYSAADVVLLGVATHKYSRLISKDRVTSALRAPFTRYQHDAGPGEVEEEARGEGMRRAIGELMVCPYCIGMWVSVALSLGLVVAPRRTRFIATVGTVLAISDALHHGQRALEEHT